MFELDEFLHHFERVRERTRTVAACIPAEHVEWTCVNAPRLVDLEVEMKSEVFEQEIRRPGGSLL